MGDSKKRTPVSRESVSTSKTPTTIEEVGGYYQKNPSWRFSNADMEHERWSVLEVQEGDVVEAPSAPGGTKITYDFSQSIDRALLDGLMARESTAWSTILTQNGGRRNGTNSHNIPIGELIKEAQERATELNLDTDVLLSLRLDGTRRVFGMLEEDGVLRVVWFDRNHEICPVSPR